MKAIQIVIIVMAVMVAATAAGVGALMFREPVQVVESPDQSTPVIVQNEDNSPVVDNTVTVSATGKVTLRPDVAYITVGVETRNADVKTAQTENAQIMDAVYAAVKKFGLKEEDMTTVNYYINPVYDDNKYDKPTAYTVSNNARLRVKNLEDLGDIIDAAAAAGANESWGISFDVLDRESAYNDALADAVGNAKIRAQSIAQAAGLTVGALVRVSESGSYSPYYTSYARAEMAADSVSTPISTGEMVVTATVQAVFILGK